MNIKNVILKKTFGGETFVKRGFEMLLELGLKEIQASRLKMAQKPLRIHTPETLAALQAELVTHALLDTVREIKFDANEAREAVQRGEAPVLTPDQKAFARQISDLHRGDMDETRRQVQAQQAVFKRVLGS